MKTDERRLAWAFREKYWWAILHDMIAHPLMAVFNYSRWTRRFHSWTSDKAWPPAKARLDLPMPRATAGRTFINYRRNG